MGLIDKFKNKEVNNDLQEELKSKVGINEKKEIEKNDTKVEFHKEPVAKKAHQLQQTESKSSEKLSPKLEKKSDDSDDNKGIDEEYSDDLELLVSNFLENYPSSKKESRMIRLQESNYNTLVKLKVHNIKLSDFVNFAINYTTKSPEYARILKLLKNPK